MSILNNGHKPRKLSLLGVGFSSADDSPESNRVLAYLEGRRVSPSAAGAARKSVIALALLFIAGIYLWHNRSPHQAPTRMPVAVNTSATTQIAQNNSAPAEPARIVDDSSNASAALSAAEPVTRGATAAASTARAPAASARRRTAEAIALKSRSDSSSQPKASHSIALAPADEAGVLQLSRVSCSEDVSAQPLPARDVHADPDAELLAALLQRPSPLPDSSPK